MGKFNYLLGEGKEVTIGEEVYTCRPLSARYMTLFMETDQKEDAVYKMVAATLQQTDETITVEDIMDLPLGIFQELSSVILDLNGLTEK